MDIGKIEKLIEVLEASRVEEISVRKGAFGVHIKKGARPARVVTAGARTDAPSQQTTEEGPSGERLILAPMVGIFHAVDGVAREGAHISAGQVVGTIESMKLLNDVVSEFSGVVRETMVEDGTPVEYGQPLYRIELD
ncbi:MAG: hypothetical protein N3B12_00070 [Armatimonadetes bacterium]|nr:hypothetical protein [Armatimonadota bacterium]